jgi:hypothetical protein
MASSQDLGRLTTLPNEILLKIIHELIDTDIRGLERLIILIESSRYIRNLFLEYPGSILVHVLRGYPVSEYLFRLFFESEDEGVEKAQDLINKANAFVTGDLKIDLSEMKRILAGEGPIDMLREINRIGQAALVYSLAPGHEKSYICLVGHPESLVYNWLHAGPAYSSASYAVLRYDEVYPRGILADRVQRVREIPGDFLLVRKRDWYFR